MSYRLIDANAIAVQCPEVNDMPCIYADLDVGLDGRHHDLRGASTLQAENAKLRELVRHLRECTRHNVCAVCEYADDACDFDYDMRELGIEVDG